MQDGSARDRVIGGMLTAIEEKGYAAVTIADIVRLAKVSKRTFYESFGTKEACFCAAYVAVSAEMLKAIEAAATSDDWTKRIDQSVRAYLELLESRRVLSRTFLLEIHAAGPMALRARRDVHGRFAELLREQVARARKEDRSIATLPPKLAVALVGGVNELVLVALENEGEPLGGLAWAATELVRAVVLRPA